MIPLPNSEIAFFATTSDSIIREVLYSLQVAEHEYELDQEILVELSEFFLRDIYRIDKQQRGHVSIAKWAGYWGFWIRKLKPISMVPPPYDHITEEDAVNINEIVALHFALEIVAKFRETFQREDIVRRNCRADCNGVDCFWNYASKYMNFENEFFLKYLTYSMRNRTFGPHHFALLLENIIFAACTGLDE